MKEESIESLYALILHASYALRRILGIDNSFSPIPNPENPRTYYLHNVFNEVVKCIFSIMSVKELLAKESHSEESDKQLNSDIFQAKIDEMQEWRRKFVEILIDLIGFRKAKKSIYYEHYNCLYELAKKRKENRNREVFWGCKNQKLQQQIQNLEKEASNISNKLNKNQCWYIRTSKSKDITDKLNEIADRFKKIIPHAKKYEKIFLISYYKSFGEPSEALHPKRIIDEKLKGPGDFEGSVIYNLTLALHIISIITDILQLYNCQEDSINKISRVIKSNTFSIKLVKLMTNPKISVGDFVITPEGPGIVTRKIKSQYSYRTFHVKHLLPDSSGIKIEQYIPEEVRLFQPKNEIRKRVIKILNQFGKPNMKFTPQKINKKIEESIIEAWPLMESGLGIRENTF